MQKTEMFYKLHSDPRKVADLVRSMPVGWSVDADLYATNEMYEKGIVALHTQESLSWNNHGMKLVIEGTKDRPFENTMEDFKPDSIGHWETFHPRIFEYIIEKKLASSVHVYSHPFKEYQVLHNILATRLEQGYKGSFWAHHHSRSSHSSLRLSHYKNEIKLILDIDSSPVTPVINKLDELGFHKKENPLPTF